MNDIEDDDWVREFDVSNPQKTHAGYTVYRVSSKVYPRGFPEAASEVIVFKRYKEIHMLYKELKTIYENKNAEKKQFPQFSKASYFSRFDESVIEERRKQALLLLNFAGRIYFLFTSQPFVKFFEGGIKNISRSLSKDSSDSDQQCNDEGTTQEENGELEFWTPQPYFNNAERNLEINSSDDETFETNKDLPDRDFSLDLKHEIVSSDTSLPKESAKERWLARAISLCSEGDDIETLASEAGRDENELGRQKENRADIPEVCEPTGIESHDSQPSQGSVDLLPTLLESSEGEEEDVFVDIVSSKFGEANNTGDNILQTSQGTSAKKDVNEEYVYVKSLADVGGDDTKCTEQRDTTTKLQEIKPTDRKGGKTGKNKKGVDQIAHIVSNIGVSWIDPRKKDYLFEAAQVIQQALYCEANELYEDAFNRYKMCVGILLKGVQHDSNSKRREAVRRKTAQYLVKAEFLFNTYLKQEDNGKSGWTIKSSNTSQDFALESIVDRQFCQLTLRSLKVIGIIKKVMLVQCLGLEGVFVLKVLHKTNAVHRSSRQENKQTTKGHSKKYIKSPYMVTLHRHFDTNNSIFLLLEYASGGALWNHINSLRQQKVVTDEPSRDKRSPVRTTEEESKGDLVSRDDENLCRNSDDPNVGKEYLVSLDCPVNSKSGIWTSSNDTCKTDLICETTLCVEKSDEEIKTETSEGKEHVSENVPSITNTHEPFSRTTNHSSIDKTDLAQETAPSKPEGSCGVSIREHVTTTSDVLGYLDYVTHVNQVNDRCVQRWVAELLLAIASLHSCGIIMKDLKPENVLMDDNGHLILSYFGSWEEVDHSIDPEAVEHLYCAPEISCGERISFASDWWSLGVLSYELVTGKSLSSSHPWGIHSHSSINFPSDNISPEARSFLTGLICHNASERLGSGMNGVEEIRSHAFFKGIDWDELSKRS